MHQDHDHGGSGEMAFEEKMEKLLTHWIQHNTDHAASYKEWAEKAGAHHLEAVAGMLDEVAEMTLAINDKFREALSFLK